MMGLFEEDQTEVEHTNYPHEPGTLYDCPACEAECFCGDLNGIECVHCQDEEERALWALRRNVPPF